MMEIVYGPVLIGCLVKAVLFGALFGLLFPYSEARLTGRLHASAMRKAGLGLFGGGLFGLAGLVMAVAGDGHPPRIILVAGGMLVLSAAIGFVCLLRAGGAPAQA